jgi:hypothetical protein
MRKGIGILAIVGFGAMASAASAAVTQSHITTPATDTVYSNPDISFGGPADPLSVGGTSDGTTGDSVDVFCVYGSIPYGSASGSSPLATIPVANDGTFSGSVDLDQFSYYACKLIAVPSGQGRNAPGGPYNGPSVYNAGFIHYPVPPGPNEGQLYDLYQASSPINGYWSVYSAGDCLLSDSYPTNPANNHDYNSALFGCTQIRQGAADNTLQIDGNRALLPYNQNQGATTFQQLQNVVTSVDATGNLQVSESEVPNSCADSPCSSEVPSGLRLDSTVTGGGNGNTLRADNRWVNTSGATKQLDVSYEIGINDPDPGWRFAGESSYSTHTGGDTVAPTPAPASLFTALSSFTACDSVSDPCGSVTWSQEPSAIAFSDANNVVLSYSRSIPAGCTARFVFDYSQGISQTAVNGFAAAAESADAGQPAVDCPSSGGPPSTTPPNTPKKKKKCRRKKHRKHATDAKKKKCKKKRKGKPKR